MSNQSKCEMARQRYCQKTYFGCCNAEDTDVEKCPYLKAIDEIERLAVENSKYESMSIDKMFVNGNRFREWKYNRIIAKDVVEILEEFVND